MKKALIGYTGFVGSNLDSQTDFTHKYNSKNIADIDGEEFDVVYCAGVQAVVWWANQNAEEDLAQINNLMDHLRTIKAKKFVLISTVDVYPEPFNVNEDTDLSQVENCPYGENRLYVENFVKENFADHHIIRLPGLFGPGIKKNVLFDLLNDNYLHALNDQCIFQYYDLRNIQADIQKVVDNNIRLMNFATEPVSSKEVIDALFPGKEYGSEPGAMKHYDFHTKNASAWGKSGNYIYDKSEVLAQLGDFVESTK